MGCLTAIVARRLLVARKPNPLGPSAAFVVAYALVFCLSVAWFSINAPDWMLCYFVPAETLSMPIVHTLFGLCLVLAALSGHTLTAVFLQRGNLAAALAVLASGAIVWFGLWALTIDRYMAIGTHAEWLAGTTVHLQASPLVGPMNVVGIIQGFCAIVPLVLLYRSGRQLRAR